MSAENPRAPVASQRSSLPLDRTYAFVQAVRGAHGERFVTAWLSHCQFEACVVWTTELGRKRLNKVCGDLIRAHGVVVRSDAEASAHFRRVTQQAAFSFRGKASSSKRRTS